MEMKLPSRVMLGEEYYNDKKKRKVKIYCFFHLSAVINPFEFESNGVKVSGVQQGCNFILVIEREISEVLLNDIFTNDKGQLYLIGYISEILPRANDELLVQKYSSGHILNRTYSTLDIRQLIIENIDDERQQKKLDWPIAITSFPPSESLASGSDYRFIRDLIDAMTDYIYSNYDDCIRRLITSLENFIHLRNLTGPSFLKKVKAGADKHNFVPNWASYIQYIIENIEIAYKIRNKIVHDKFRMSHEDKWICKKGIGTLLYYYQNRLNGYDTSKYVYSLMMQFTMIDNSCYGMKLESMEPSESKEVNFMKDMADFDKFMFEGLRFNQIELEYINSILKQGKY